MRLLASRTALALTLLTTLGCSAKQEANSGLDKIKKVHRGELSAVATYDQALAKVSEVLWRPELTRLRDEHADAARRLAERIVALGATPDANAGPWGDWAKLVAGAAAVINDQSVVGALKAGERHGVNEYEEALSHDGVDATTKDLIRSTLLPRQRQHEDALKRFSKE